MKPEQLQAIRERWDNAETGPWFIEDKFSDLYSECGNLIIREVGRSKTTEAIANAPTDIFALLDEVERLRGALEEINSLPVIEYTVEHLTKMIHTIRPIARQALAGESV